MGKVNKNIRAKAKAAAAKAAGATNNIKSKISAVAKSDESSMTEEKLLLPKTPTVKKKAITKRDKVRQKHKQLMNKFALLKKKRKEEAARKNREKTAVIGDLKPLKDALPSLDELFKLSKQKSDIKTGIKNIDESTQSNQKGREEKKLNVKQKLKKKKEKFIRQVSSYQALLKDPDFKKNPRDAISYHIKYKHGLIDE
ncbi:protein FAM207A isoform X2 [Rhagoletis pomonella]|uniref:protein FAM207A isoform X1 n=1 Tax=Rhagoletis pomonella TaxID=28610 RepID=UPI00177D638D|nr:protein FAM207A isoform X1 [Rhagoletis pomonella]XP_036336552.1 protein FAM207A isoform X2 [Rhagoletis pomonella]